MSGQQRNTYDVQERGCEICSETTKETLKYFNLERNIETDLHGIARSPELTVEDLLED